MKKMPTGHFATLLAIAITTFIACKKNEAVIGQNGIQEDPKVGLIDSARRYFEESVLKKAPPTNTQKTPKKTPLWEKAKIKNHNGQNVIIIPLKFEGNVSYKSNHLDGYTLPADLQTKLVIYKDKDGRFHDHLYTAIPNETYLAQKTKDYSGILVIEDWDRTNSNSYIGSSGKFRRLSATSANFVPPTETTNSTVPSGYSCYYLNIYYCYYDEFGNKEDCTFLDSKFLGCYEDQNESQNYLDNSDGGPLINVLDETVELPIGRPLRDKIDVSTCFTKDDYQKSKCYRWKVYEISGGSFLPSYVVSRERADLVRFPGNYYWEFKSFTHEGIGVEGYSLGYKVTISNDKGIPSIMYGNGLNNQKAMMFLTFHVNINAEKNGLTASYDREASTDQTWDVNE